jgi:hypothetical protein
MASAKLRELETGTPGRPGPETEGLVSGDQDGSDQESQGGSGSGSSEGEVTSSDSDEA